jgi:acetyl-CoA C-acetyltransferase
MAEAYIIDAVRTPRSVGKMGKGALSTLHPQHVAATVLRAIKDRNSLNTADVDDIGANGPARRRHGPDGCARRRL